MSLDREIRQVLAELELISHGTTASYNPGGGHNDPLYPPGEMLPPHLDYRRRYQRCWTDYQRRNVIDAARKELDRIKRTPAKPVLPFKQRILTEWEGHGDTEVAQVTNTPRSTIRLWRKQAGLNPTDGTRRAA